MKRDSWLLMMTPKSYRTFGYGPPRRGAAPFQAVGDGIDWATQTHRVCVMDANGEVLREQTVQHEGDAIRELLRSLDALTGSQPEKVGVAIEVPRGPVVEAFLERNYAVFGVKMAEIMRRHGLTPAPPQGRRVRARRGGCALIAVAPRQRSGTCARCG